MVKPHIQKGDPRTPIHRARGFMQLHIFCSAELPFFFYLEISLFAFFARPVNFNGKVLNYFFSRPTF